MKNGKKIFLELQGVRGIAVIFVLLFHFYPNLFPGGFVGVDIFFVLSGFLVTFSIFKNLDVTKVSYSLIDSFYVRRISRILPMAFIISSVALLLELLFMDIGKVAPATKSFTYSILGLTNIKLYNSASDYFSLDSDFSFFTHTWSLGVEEQFYLFYSLTILISLFAFRKKINTFFKIHFLLIFCAFLSSISLLFYLSVSNSDVIFAFYMLPARLFQLASGVLLYYFIYESVQEKVKGFLAKKSKAFLVSSYILLLCFLFLPNISSLFPFSMAILLVLPVIVICYYSTQESIANNSTLKWLKNPILVWVGNISYSLYLVHWLIVVFIRHTFGNSYLHSALGLILSLIFSSMTYNIIEKPLNVFLSKKRLRAYLFLSLVILSSLINFIPFQHNKISLHNLVKHDLKFWDEEAICHGFEDLKAFKNPLESCLGRKSEKKTIFVNGDSHAVGLTFGLEEAARGWADVRYINLESSNDSHGFTLNQSKIFHEKPAVFDFLEKEVKSGDLVALTFKAIRIVEFTPQQLESSFAYWAMFIEAMKTRGVSVILFLDNPRFEKLPINRCVIQLALFGNKSSCLLKTSEILQERKNQEYWFNLLSKKYNNVFIYDMAKHFCDKEYCSMFKDSDLLFIDHHHISKTTSLSLSENFKSFFLTNGLIDL